MVALVSRFVSALYPKAASLLLSRSTPVPLPLRTVLYEPHQLPKYAFFLTSGVASVVTGMADGETAEVEIIGHEGLVGSFHLLGSAPVSTSCFMQVSGTGLRIELSALQALFQSSGEIRSRILELVQQQALCISQLSSCNGLHRAEARLARWLLMVQDRTQSDTLPDAAVLVRDVRNTADEGHQHGRSASALRDHSISAGRGDHYRSEGIGDCGLRLLPCREAALLRPVLQEV